MTPPKKGFKTTDEYIASFPQNVQAPLQQIRQAIKDTAPQAKEVISYSMPAFKQKGILVWFAAFKNHIGFFPKVSAVETFKEQLASYQTSKGTIRFPLDKPIPIGLIQEIVKFRVKEDQSEE
jgi:uncharacterized protein YdhG (YjbR/CyaY superfamily)